MSSICAVVVTFNRRVLLGECLSALLKQTVPLERIYVIDNASTDGTSAFLEQNGFLSEPSVSYIRLPKNIGGSGGFYEGIKRAFTDGFDWIWVMDDDAEPHLDAAEAFLPYFADDSVVGLANRKVGIDGQFLPTHCGQKSKWYEISSLARCPSDENQYSADAPTEIYYSSFVGLAVKREAIQKIGFPKKEFFIGVDDTEYCARLSRVGRILLLPQSVIVHKEAAKKRELRQLFGYKIERTPIGSSWRFYFLIRNELVAEYEHRGAVSTILTALYFFFRLTVGIILFDDHKKKRLTIIARAYLDFLRGRYDNDWALRQRV